VEIGPITRALRRNKTRFVLIVLQIAITLAVVTNAITLILSEREKMQISSGFDDANLVWVMSRPFASAFGERAYRVTSAETDLRALRAIPGVVSVTNTSFIPWQGGGSSGRIKAAGGDGSSYQSQVYNATPGFIDTLGIRLVEGRDIKQNDINDDPDYKGPSTVLISRDLEKLVFKNGSAVGRQIAEVDGSFDNIVGVFDPFYQPYGGWPIERYCMIYAGHVSRRGAPFLVRVKPGAMKSVVAAIEPVLLKANDGRNVRMRTIAEFKDQLFSQAHVIIGGMTAVIVLILLVTGLGIVGVTSFSVTERRKQIGTRRALGATKFAILRYFLMENWIVTNAGLLIGIVAAYALNIGLVTKAGGAKLDPTFLVIAVLLLWVQGIVATLVPALRATRVSPVVATRGA
jgi:putative ABC transport system permease protein